ncbi:MAG TPA: DUF2617 family protein [Actinocrinis sp.]|nr:DUF2617 family protein [Actinocrinis sp.]
MFVELTAAYCDTSAGELGWSIDLEPQPALASRRLDLGPFQAELRLLGASHQISVWLGSGPRGGPEPLCLETVACMPERTVPLPRTAECELRGWRYTIESDVRTCSEAEFGVRVAGIEQCAAHGLAGRYPGLPGALTGIAMRPWQAGLWWTTWHTYPQNRQIATTLSFLRLE